MIINDFILKNEKLSASMKVYSHEIDRLEQLRDLFKTEPDQEQRANPDLTAAINRKLKKAKEDFCRLNDSYDEGAHKIADLCTSAFISEVNEGLEAIKEFFSKIHYR